jgi:hypothetical protein
MIVLKATPLAMACPWPSTRGELGLHANEGLAASASAMAAVLAVMARTWAAYSVEDRHPGPERW